MTLETHTNEVHVRYCPCYFGFLVLGENVRFYRQFIPMVLIKINGSIFQSHETVMKTDLFVYCNYRIATGTC